MRLMIQIDKYYNFEIIKAIMNAQTQENIVKSIIYGNLISNSYGLMRALCSAITSKDHIDKIILFLRNNQNFQKYNKFIYAFRLEQQPNQNQVFLTQDNPTHPKFLEGYNDDTGLQGNGEKLLSLLQKFNVRNVLVIVALRQKDSLRQFYSENYVQIVKCAKDLLSSLYDKVVLSKNESNTFDQKGQIEKISLQTKEYLIPLQTFVKPMKPQENANYVGKQFIRKPEEMTAKQKYEPQLEFLNFKIKQLAGILEQIIQRFSQNEDAQVKFAIKYDKNKKVNKVFSLLVRLFDCKNKEELLDNSMSTYLKSITSRNLTAHTIRSLNEQLMSDKTIRSQNIIKENKICGILMQFLQVLLKSYSFAKKLAVIQSQIEDKIEEQNEDEVTI